MTAPAPRHRHASSVAAEGDTGQLPSPERRVRRKEAARYLADVWGIPTSPKTLAKLALTGGGPSYRKAGRFPLYEIAARHTQRITDRPDSKPRRVAATVGLRRIRE
jgi:hypothetical protein